jgi:hypothetical protein
VPTILSADASGSASAGTNVPEAARASAARSVFDVWSLKEVAVPSHALIDSPAHFCGLSAANTLRFCSAIIRPRSLGHGPFDIAQQAFVRFSVARTGMEYSRPDRYHPNVRCLAAGEFECTKPSYLSPLVPARPAHLRVRGSAIVRSDAKSEY